MLGGMLEKIRAKAESFGVTEAQLETLIKAKNARNLIAHEGIDIGPLFNLKRKNVLQALESLRLSVADLAAGDNIVSAWMFFLDEPREPVPHISHVYQDLIDRWVFGHLLGGDDSSSWAIAVHQGLPGIPPITRRELRGLCRTSKIWLFPSYSLKVAKFYDTPGRLMGNGFSGR